MQPAHAPVAAATAVKPPEGRVATCAAVKSTPGNAGPRCSPTAVGPWPTTWCVCHVRVSQVQACLRQRSRRLLLSKTGRGGSGATRATHSASGANAVTQLPTAEQSHIQRGKVGGRLTRWVCSSAQVSRQGEATTHLQSRLVVLHLLLPGWLAVLPLGQDAVLHAPAG